MTMLLTKKKIKRKGKEIEAITFEVEKLERAKEALETKDANTLLEHFERKIEAHAPIERPLVAHGFHSFLYSMYRAYAEHRPFVLSPDMIWLLICQGFAQHVNFSKGKDKDLFPFLLEKKQLTYQTQEIILGKSDSPWHKSTQGFVEQIGDHIGKELIDVLRADFSTTGIAERVASEITIMDALKSYFEYIVVYCVCGIPEITLEGTREDWLSIKNKLDYLRKFNLDDWINPLQGILDEFVETAEGKVKPVFWMNMFKVHTSDSYGAPKNIDGWIRYFYPYDRKGNKLDMRKLQKLSIDDIFKELPKELACVDFKYLVIDMNGTTIAEYDMEYWAGFIGADQDEDSLALRPEIGWFVAHQPVSQSETQDENSSAFMDGKKYYNLTKFPDEVFNVKEWYELYLNFKGKVDIPKKIRKLNVHYLHINGDITENELDHWRSFFKGTKCSVHINGSKISKE